VLAVHHLHRLRLEQAGIPRSKISEVMNSPESSIFEAPRVVPLDAPSDAAMDRGGFILVCHGTVTRRLGIDVAIKAVSLLLDRIPELRLRMIGAGDYLEDAKALAARLGVASRISFEGLVPIEELPRVLQAAAIGLVPNHDSNATRLMLPVKLLEYASLGIPVIGSRLRTVEYYFPQDAVRMVAPGDPNALAAAILELYQDPARRRELARNAHRAISRTSWAHQRGIFFRAVDSLLKSRSGSETEAAHPLDTSGPDQDGRLSEQRISDAERL
jgi:glycosyltransferase involved in cell wall biosynthesis